MNRNTASFSYVYKNNTPYGKNAIVTYDNFYKTYSISFTKQNGNSTSCMIKDKDFIGIWNFKYNGAIYSLVK